MKAYARCGSSGGYLSTSLQEGNGNSAITEQYGIGYSSVISQTGNGNSATVSQKSYGFDN